MNRIYPLLALKQEYTNERINAKEDSYRHPVIEQIDRVTLPLARCEWIAACDEWRPVDPITFKARV